MDDQSKFMETKHYLSLDDIIKKEPAITKIERPQHIDPLGDDSKYGKKSRDYKMTQALARRMSLMRAVEMKADMEDGKPYGQTLRDEELGRRHRAIHTKHRLKHEKTKREAKENTK